MELPEEAVEAAETAHTAYCEAQWAKGNVADSLRAMRAAIAALSPWLDAPEGDRALLSEAVKVLEKITAYDREALAEHRPKWGIADCVDNQGSPYQSAALAETLSTARALVSRIREEVK